MTRLVEGSGAKNARHEVERGTGGQGMDVKGAKALSERLAEAARNADPSPAKAVDSGDTDQRSEVADTAAKV
jgi:hypothetical protein